MYRETLQELAPTFNAGCAISREYYDERMAGRQNPDICAEILPEMCAEARTALWMEKERRYAAVIDRGIKPIAGLVELLAFCGREDLATAVVTNSPKGMCGRTLGALGLSERFGRNVVVAEDCDYPKPHPAPYQAGLMLTGVKPSEALAFEDSPSGTASATAAGIFTIGVLSTQPPSVLLEAGAALCIQNFADPALYEALQLWLSL